MSSVRPHGQAPTPRAARRSGGRAAQQNRASARPWLLIAFVAVVIVGAGVAAILLGGQAASQVSGEPSQRSGVASPRLSGSPLPAFDATAVDLAVGRSIPDAVGVSFDETPIRIVSDGTPKILLFLAHWCPHCQVEVPVVQRWLNADRLPAGIDLISIATSIDPNRPNYPPDAWLDREGWTPPVLVDPANAVATHFGLQAFPYWVVVAADGTVAQRLTGELTEAQLDDLAASLQ